MYELASYYDSKHNVAFWKEDYDISIKYLSLYNSYKSGNFQ